MTDEPQRTNVPEYSVSQLAGALKRTVEDAYGFVRVRGELGRVVVARSGHMYVDVKDDKAVIASVMWKGSAAKLAFKPEEGLEVVCEGKLTTYPGRSQYQLVIERMSPAGVGALMALLEERKKKLAAEGLFDDARKKAIPFLPEVIGVVTSPTGAVIRDILHRVRDRFPRHVLLWPVLVQGDKAAEQVAAAVEGFNRISGDGPVPRPDVLIVARGGGSIEDLWPFNEEIVARAVDASTIPVISAVGHETDTTLIDYVSDRRAPTPTGAAEMATPVRAELAARLDTLGGRLSSALVRGVEKRGADLKAAARGLPRPDDLLGPRAQRLDAASERLRSGLLSASDQAAIRFQRVAARLRPEALARDRSEKARRTAEASRRINAELARMSKRRRERLADAVARLAARAPISAIAGENERLNEAAARLSRAGLRSLGDAERRLDALRARLESVSPKAVLGRGYALVRDETGAIARRAGDLAPGDQVVMEFADGSRQAIVDGDKPRSGRSKKKSESQGALF